MLRFVAVISMMAVLVALASPPVANAGTLPNISGTWYAQGDHSKRCRISQSGDSLRLTNERGQTANGKFLDPGRITSSWPTSAYTSMGPRTQIEGRISGNLDTILWNNSTRWTRSPTGASSLPDLSGTWYSGGDPGKICRIREHGSSLTLTNESGQTAIGAFLNPRTISATWSGQKIQGHLSQDLWRIDWSNHTRWTRGSY